VTVVVVVMVVMTVFGRRGRARLCSAGNTWQRRGSGKSAKRGDEDEEQMRHGGHRALAVATRRGCG
jgi:hypothetical protein